MIIGIGTDIVMVERIERSLRRYGDRFAERVLSAVEMSEYRKRKDGSKFVAKRFAVKEAVSKALGTGISEGVGWHDMEVDHDDLGKPLLKLSGGAQKRADQLGARHCHISISDEKQHVLAFAVLES